MWELKTKWGLNIREDEVLKEYPRPSMVRESYLNLNGIWEYGIGKGKTAKYEGKILVPFSPETNLSGVKRLLKPGERLYYKKGFILPEGFKKDIVLLHFGAVDQECEVFINSVSVKKHLGGYLPFHADITELLIEGENIIELDVADCTEKKPHARGKQRLKKRGSYAGIFYTPQSGIWKTVWIESVYSSYIKNIRLTPLYNAGAFEIEVLATGNEQNAQVSVREGEEPVKCEKISVNKKQIIKLDKFKEWTPENPFLYDVEISYCNDKIKTYFGMRKWEIKKDKRGILRFYLNDKPIFFNGILDQGYWPESLMTPPSDEALLYDIVKLKELGFNTIRKHVKIENERFYYYCDRLGMIVWQDMPNGGGEYNMTFVTALPNLWNWFARGVSDKFYKLFAREDGGGRRQYYRDLKGMIKLLYNHPSIAIWVPFNEGWGQFDAAKATKLIRENDGTRLVNEACGWFDQGGGDLYSIHNYRHALKVKPQKKRAVALTEFGGYAYAVKGHLYSEKEFGYKHYGSEEELTESVVKLYERDVIKNIPNGLSAAIYTQLSDIEEEINGILTYDREKVKFTEKTLKSINRRIYERFEECLK